MLARGKYGTFKSVVQKMEKYALESFAFSQSFECAEGECSLSKACPSPGGGGKGDESAAETCLGGRCKRGETHAC